jgi:hypothetical protein
MARAGRTLGSQRSVMSPIGTKLPTRDVRYSVAVEGKADVHRAIVSAVKSKAGLQCTGAVHGGRQAVVMLLCLTVGKAVRHVHHEVLGRLRRLGHCESTRMIHSGHWGSLRSECWSLR